jgi:arginine decarboxylase
MLKVCETLRDRGLLDCLQLLHFHVGSQISAIRNIKGALKEAARFYVELRKLGAGLTYLDVGGGLAVDYDGSNTNFAVSMNYSMQEYANDVVFQIMEVCDDAGVEHPHIVSESGRALTAHHSMLIFNVLGVCEAVGQETFDPAQASEGSMPEQELPEDAPNVLWNLRETCSSVTRKNVLEAYHDSVQLRDEAVTMFNLGYLSLKQRALAERLFWATCRRVLRIVRGLPTVPEELEHLERSMADTYFCNFSLFQSVPDHWAINHLFPIMPVHRLNERPVRRGILADITCDSDGKIEDFIDLKDVKQVLELHPFTSESYYLGIFLVGAYQEILGDLHNLFGDTNAVHISLENGGYKVEQVETGDTVEDVLHYVSYDKNEMLHRLRSAAEAAVRAGKMSVEDLRLFVTMYQNGMDGYTYLEG